MSPDFEVKSFSVELKADPDTRTVTGYGATWEKDLMDDVIVPGAFAKTLTERLPGGRIKYLQDHHIPVGIVTEAEEDKKGLQFTAKVIKTANGDEHLELVRSGVISQASIGFRAKRVEFDKDADFRKILEVNPLLEVSGVLFPANPGTAVSVAKGGELFELKTALPFANLPLAPRDRPWSRRDAEGRVRSWAGVTDEPNTKYRWAFSWWDPAEPEDFGSYKLMIADVIDGALTAVPRAIFAAAVVVQGGRGGLDVPPSDLAGIRRHLGRYYMKMREEFDDDTMHPPWETAKGLDVASDDFAVAFSEYGKSLGLDVEIRKPVDFEKLIGRLSAARNLLRGDHA